MRLIPLVPALLLTASAAVAVETHDVDLRLNIAAAPGIDQVEVKDAATVAGAPDPAANGTYDFTSKYGISFEPSIMFRTGWHGLGIVGGPGLFLSTLRGEKSVAAVTNKRSIVAYGAMAELGPSFQWDWLRLEVLPMIGVGLGHAKTETIDNTAIPTKNSKENSNDALYFQYGIRAGLYADNDQGLVGFQVGWQAFHTQAKFESIAGSSTVSARDSDTETLTGSGIYAAFVAGVAF